MDYYYKYKKYKSKYLAQIGAAKNIEEQYLEKLNIYFSRIQNEVITAELVNKIIEFFKQFTVKNYDPEFMHMLEDELSTQFISGIADKKIVDITTIQNIATLIKKLNDMNYLK